MNISSYARCIHWNKSERDFPRASTEIAEVFADEMVMTDAGFTGASGPAGATGQIGFTGASGNVGSTGLSGAIGQQGQKGYQGSPGPFGAMGYTGSTGQTGYPGNPGQIGFPGEYCKSTVFELLKEQISCGVCCSRIVTTE
jgi:hypothetical protein